MLSPAHPVMVTLHVISLAAGLVGNIFILAVIFIGWFKSSSDLSSCDFILSSLAVSNLGHLGVCFVIHTSTTYSLAFHTLNSSFSRFYVALFFLRCCSIWFATWFCTYCCAKIVNFMHPFLVRAATKFQENVHWLLLGSVLVSMAACLPIAFPSGTLLAVSDSSNSSIFTASNSSANSSSNGVSHREIYDREQIAYISNILLVFAVFLFSSVAIIATLCRHMRTMGQNAESFRTPNMEAHWGVVKTVSLLLLLYTAFCITQCIRFLNIFSFESIERAACVLLVAYFPSLNSLILIQGITKLKKTLAEMCLLSRCSGKEGA